MKTTYKVLIFLIFAACAYAIGVSPSNPKLYTVKVKLFYCDRKTEVKVYYRLRYYNTLGINNTNVAVPVFGDRVASSVRDVMNVCDFQVLDVIRTQ